MNRCFGRCGAGFTLAEILVVVAILLALSVLLVSAVRTVMSYAHFARCAANLQNISAASRSYAADNRGTIPPNASGIGVFATALRPYLGEDGLSKSNSLKRSVLICSADPDSYDIAEYGLSYAQNGYIGAVSGLMANRVGLSIASWEHPSKMAVYLDYESHYVATVSTWQEERVALLAQRHGGKINVAFGDGHIEPVVMTNIDWNLPNSFWQGR